MSLDLKPLSLSCVLQCSIIYAIADGHGTEIWKCLALFHKWPDSNSQTNNACSGALSFVLLLLAVILNYEKCYAWFVGATQLSGNKLGQCFFFVVQIESNKKS